MIFTEGKVVMHLQSLQHDRQQNLLNTNIKHLLIINSFQEIVPINKNTQRVKCSVSMIPANKHISPLSHNKN